MSAALIYVVDDEAEVGGLLSLSLQIAGFRVQTFANPGEALATFTRADPKPAVVFADFHMPGMDGLQLLQRCKEIAPAVKTIIYSGSLSEEARARSAFQPDGLLQKPSSYRELVATVQRLLRTEAPP